MKVKDVMTRTVACVRPKDSIAVAAEMMRDLDIGVLPVWGDDDCLLGMVTDRDITVRATAAAGDPQVTWVRDIMTPTVVHCSVEQEVADAVQLMQEHQIRRLIVLDHDRRLAGILSLGDVALDTGDRRLTGETLEAISTPQI